MYSYRSGYEDGYSDSFEVALNSLSKNQIYKEQSGSFYEAFKSNPDWVWILVRNWKEIKTYKFKNATSAWKFYSALEEYTEIVIHFRLWTSWWLDYDMMHPFPLWEKNWWWLF